MKGDRAVALRPDRVLLLGSIGVEKTSIGGVREQGAQLPVPRIIDLNGREFARPLEPPSLRSSGRNDRRRLR
jgi:hypothetical protein